MPHQVEGHQTVVTVVGAAVEVEGVVVEVHLSNVHKRETFRHHSYVSLRADGVIAGLGIEGYAAAIRHILRQLGTDD